MDITGCILVSENEVDRFDNTENYGVSLLMKDTDEILHMDDDGNLYIEDNPKILGVFVSRNNIPLLQRVLEIIDDYKLSHETENNKSEFMVGGDTEAQFVPDKEFIELVQNSSSVSPLPILSIDDSEKEEV